uniref:Uncharacterized protein n=1 Tax=Rhodnius prolixus TaxID=13249 RepID=T1HY12_RHOPR
MTDVVVCEIVIWMCEIVIWTIGGRLRLFGE